MKRFAPLLGIIVLVGVLAFLNKGINKNASGDEDTPPPPAPAAKQSASTTPAAKDPLAPEIILGNPAATQYKITVGWIYDSVNQTNSAALTQAIDVVEKSVAASGNRASAVIVNLDTPPEELSPEARAVTGLGVAINGDAGGTVGGKQISLAGNPGEGSVTMANINTVLGATLPPLK